MGAEIALAFTESVTQVAVHGNSRPATQTAELVGPTAEAFAADLSTAHGVEELFLAAKARFGQIDILVTTRVPFIARRRRLSHWKSGAASCR